MLFRGRNRAPGAFPFHPPGQRSGEKGHADHGRGPAAAAGAGGAPAETEGPSFFLPGDSVYENNQSGFLVQLLPYADPAVVETIEANIGKIDSVSRMVDSGMTPQDIIDTVFAGLAYDVLDTAEIDYVCPCSRERYARALLSLGKEELQRLVNEDEPVETLCSFCGKKYVFGLDEVRAMLEKAK